VRSALQYYSGLVVGHIGLALHIGGITVAMAIIVFASVNKLSPVLIKANEDKEEHMPLRTLITSFRVDWLVSGGLLCAVFLEFSYRRLVSDLYQRADRS